MEEMPAAHTAYDLDRAQQYDQQRFTSDAGIRIHHAELDVLRPYVSALPAGAKVLEVGCGTGRLLMEFLDLPLVFQGSDASPEMLAEFKQKLQARREQTGKSVDVQLSVAEAVSQPMDSESFDLVYSIRLLNQTESPQYALRVVAELARICKPGGTVLVEFANRRRPRIAGNKNPSTRLLADEVKGAMLACGLQPTKPTGAFFLGMGASIAAPSILLPLVGTADRLAAGLAPAWCARVYVAGTKA
ncbi:MAG: class I SAM-dependent methyltransferase [Candidatus Nanopelagicales bacterium]